jgi:D-xylonolactonase
LLLFHVAGEVRRLREGNKTEPVLAPEVWENPDAVSGEGAAETYDMLRHLLNDALTDEAGRVYIGVLPMGGHDGGLFLVDTDRRVHRVVRGKHAWNGLGLSVDGTKLYGTDSWGFINIYERDVESGLLENEKLFAEIPTETEGRPDGLAVDVEGYVWSARWDGGCLVRYAPDGSEDLRVPFPVEKVTSVAFGGADYKDLYVTTASLDADPANAYAGGLFRLRVETPGIPGYPSRICRGLG